MRSVALCHSHLSKRRQQSAWVLEHATHADRCQGGWECGAWGRGEDEVKLIENVTFESRHEGDEGWPECLCPGTLEIKGLVWLQPGCLRQRRWGETSKNTRAVPPVGPGTDLELSLSSTVVPACEV